MSSRNLLYMKRRLKRRYEAWRSRTRDPFCSGRNMFVIEGLLFTVAFNLSWGIFLAGYLKHIGVNDAINGFIAVLPVLIGVIQPVGAFTTAGVRRRKPLMLKLAAFQRFSYALLYFVPFLMAGQTARTAVVVALVLIFNLLLNFLNPAFMDWIASLAPGGIRGRYLAVREVIMVIAVAVVNLAAGGLLDYFAKSGNASAGFMIIGAFIFALFAGNIAVMSRIYEPQRETSEDRVNLKQAYIEPFCDKHFRRCIYVAMIWNFAFQLGIPYLNVYFVSFINLDYSFIMAVGLVAALERVFMVRMWSRMAEERSWTYVCQVALILVGAAYIGHMFIIAGNAWWMYTLMTLAVNVPWAVISASLLNLQFDNAPEDRRSMYIGANAAAQGVTGFLGGLLGAAFMGFMGRRTAASLTAPQILVCVSGALMICSGLYIKYFIRGISSEVKDINAVT